MTRRSGRYVLFLQKFEFERGVQYDGQYTATGGRASVFTVKDDVATSSVTAFGQRRGLPASLRMGDVS